MTRSDKPTVAFVLSGGASLGAHDHLVPASGLRRLIARHVQLEDLPILLQIVAVDVISCEELRPSHGPVVDAVVASVAIPGVVPPVRWEDRTLIDGGVANNTPISHAVQLGAEQICVLPTGTHAHSTNRQAGALALALPRSAC